MEYLEVDNATYKNLKSDHFQEVDHFRRHKKKKKHGIQQAPATGSLTNVPDGVPPSIGGSETPIGDQSSQDINVAPDMTEQATANLPIDPNQVIDGSDVDDGTNSFENHLNIFQKAGRFASKEAKQAGKFAKKEIGTVAGAAALLPLLPLKPMMKKLLNKKGIKYSNKLKDISNKFYNEVIKKHPSAYDDFEYPQHDLDNYTENNIIDVAIEIVEEIIKFIKGIKDKASKGTLLTDIEKDVLDGSNDAVNKIKKKGRKGGHGGMGRKKPMNMKIIGIGAGVIILIIILVMVFRKK